MLDRSRPFAQIIGQSENNARFHQDGKEFDAEGNEIQAMGVSLQLDTNTVSEAAPVKKKPGRPRKEPV